MSKQYVYGAGIDEIFNVKILTGDKAGDYYYHTDGIGSITAITDKDGNIVERVKYGIYGIPTILDKDGNEIAESTIGNTYMFQGRRYEKSLNMYYYRARHYDPTTGRFLSPDPLGYVDSLNLYQGMNMNPYNFVDPMGLTMMIFYIKEGLLVVDPEQTGRAPYIVPATSGKDKDMNNPRSIHKSFKGPLPIGVYEMNIDDMSDGDLITDLKRNFHLDWGDWRIRLKPVDVPEGFGRDGFFLHGGKFLGSAGCIDIGGGSFGNDTTIMVKRDIMSDPDGKIKVIVYASKKQEKEARRFHKAAVSKTRKKRVKDEK